MSETITPPEKGPDASVTFPSLHSSSWSSLQHLGTQRNAKEE